MLQLPERVFVGLNSGVEVGEKRVCMRSIHEEKRDLYYGLVAHSFVIPSTRSLIIWAEVGRYILARCLNEGDIARRLASMRLLHTVFAGHPSCLLPPIRYNNRAGPVRYAGLVGISVYTTNLFVLVHNSLAVQCVFWQAHVTARGP